MLKCGSDVQLNIRVGPGTNLVTVKVIIECGLKKKLVDVISVVIAVRLHIQNICCTCVTVCGWAQQAHTTKRTHACRNSMHVKTISVSHLWTTAGNLEPHLSPMQTVSASSGGSTLCRLFSRQAVALFFTFQYHGTWHIVLVDSANHQPRVDSN